MIISVLRKFSEVEVSLNSSELEEINLKLALLGEDNPDEVLAIYLTPEEACALLAPHCSQSRTPRVPETRGDRLLCAPGVA